MLHPNNPVVQEDASIHDVVAAIAKHKIGAVAVVNEINMFKGIITDGDFRRAFLLDEAKLQEHTANDIMNTNPTTLNESATIGDLISVVLTAKHP